MEVSGIWVLAGMRFLLLGGSVAGWAWDAGTAPASARKVLCKMKFRRFIFLPIPLIYEAFSSAMTPPDITAIKLGRCRLLFPVMVRQSARGIDRSRKQCSSF